MAVLLKPDGTVRTVRPLNGTDFTNDEIHELVGGFWQVVSPMVLGTAIIHNETDTVVVEIVRGSLFALDEEGKLKELPLNKTATLLFRNPDDYIVGNALLCGPGEIV